MNTFRDWKAKTNDELELFCRSVELRKLYDYTKAKEFNSKQQIQQKKTQDNNLKHIIDDILPKGTFVADRLLKIHRQKILIIRCEMAKGSY